MTKSEETNLAIVHVLDPDKCLKPCRFAHIADVLFTDGTIKKMFYCSRLDCDNWKMEEMPAGGVKEISRD